MGDVILTGFWLIVSVFGVVVGLGVYGLPTIIAVWRKSPNIALIAVVNLVLGGLFVPWWIALGMALWSADRRGDVTVVQTTNLPPAPPVAPSALAQPGTPAPVQGALPASPSVQPPVLPPAHRSEQEEPRYPQRSSSAPGYGFAPPPPYGESTPSAHRPSFGRGR